MPRHVRKGDRVIVTSGYYKGQQGEVLRVIPDDDRVVVKGVNVRTKHLKPNRLNPQGGIVQREEPIHISKVSPVVDGKPTRVRFVNKPDGSKVRVAARGGKELGVVHGPRTSAGESGKPVARAASKAKTQRGAKAKK